jgi:hypothetical protein
MSSVIVRRSTLTIRSTIGIRMNRPGPFGSEKRRPSRNTIARSYSRATLIAEIRNNTSSKSKIATMISAAGMSSPFECVGCRNLSSGCTSRSSITRKFGTPHSQARLSLL